MKRTVPSHHVPFFCAYPQCTDHSQWRDTPLCPEHAALMWKTFDEHASEAHKQVIRGDHREAAAEVRAGESAIQARRRATINRPGSIYYLRVGDRVKIGFTTDLYRRMMQYPPNSELLASHPGTPALEKEMHQDFSRHLADGREWFHPNAELDAHIQKVQEKYPNTATIAQMRQPIKNSATLRAAPIARRA